MEEKREPQFDWPEDSFPGACERLDYYTRELGRELVAPLKPLIEPALAAMIWMLDHLNAAILWLLGRMERTGE